MATAFYSVHLTLETQLLFIFCFLIFSNMKPQNVLLNKSNDALVADLGTVRRPGEIDYERTPLLGFNLNLNSQ